MNEYQFISERLGFRTWCEADLKPMAVLNADPEVMRFFPSTQSEKQTRELMNKCNAQFDKYGHCYFAVDRLSDKTFIGFIGLAYQEYEAPFTPCVDIGWRLAKQFWNNGYATEGARRCLEYGFEVLELDTIYSIASEINTPSINVMKKIGMNYQYHFDHPELTESGGLNPCTLYQILR